jgi:hypothetical protein
MAARRLTVLTLPVCMRVPQQQQQHAQTYLACSCLFFFAALSNDMDKEWKTNIAGTCIETTKYRLCFCCTCVCVCVCVYSRHKPSGLEAETHVIYYTFIHILHTRKSIEQQTSRAAQFTNLFIYLLCARAAAPSSHRSHIQTQRRSVSSHRTSPTHTPPSLTYICSLGHSH